MELSIEYRDTLRKLVEHIKKEYGLETEIRIAPDFYGGSVLAVIFKDRGITMNVSAPAPKTCDSYEWAIDKLLKFMEELRNSNPYVEFGKKFKEAFKFLTKE